MSDVKQRVIDIVMGREPIEPKVMVALAPDEVVVKREAGLSEIFAAPYGDTGTICAKIRPTPEPQGDGAEQPYHRKPFIRFGLCPNGKNIWPRPSEYDDYPGSHIPQLVL